MCVCLMGGIKTNFLLFCCDDDVVGNDNRGTTVCAHQSVLSAMFSFGL